MGLNPFDIEWFLKNAGDDVDLTTKTYFQKHYRQNLRSKLIAELLGLSLRILTAADKEKSWDEYYRLLAARKIISGVIKKLSLQR